MRVFLDKLYRLSGGLAAFFLAAIGLSVVAQVVGRQLGYTVDATGFAGFCLAASTFLGLGYSMRHGTHVRVTLIIDALPPKLKRVLEAWVCLCSFVILFWLTLKAVIFTWQGYVFNEVSPGLIAIPLWIPQLGMVTGLLIITVAVLDDLIGVLMKSEVSYRSAHTS
ncbi:MAG: TRAP transporter small permease [Halomonas sp.]|uniref:TRAP transporter small permease n=1 Tax=Halomonas sp. TaxID=1486246 RepID=UPI003F909582